MTSRFLLTAIAMLTMSVVANAATPLGVTERRDEDDALVKARKTLTVSIKHDKPKAIKRVTQDLPKHFMSHAKKHAVIANKKGGTK